MFAHISDRWYCWKHKKFPHGFDKVWRHDKTCSSFSVNMSESSMPFWEWNIKKNICWFHISSFTQVGEKTILHFWAHCSEVIYQCSKFNTGKVAPFWSCYWKFCGLWYPVFYLICLGCFSKLFKKTSSLTVKLLNTQDGSLTVTLLACAALYGQPESQLGPSYLIKTDRHHITYLLSVSNNGREIIQYFFI